jgi:hypothetical protein
MGRPRTPTKILEFSDSVKKHPERMRARENEPEPEIGLGLPPRYMDEALQARWTELQEIVPAGVLSRMDGPAAEVLCQLWVKMQRGEAQVSDRRLLSSLFFKFGLTPSDRSKTRKPCVAAPAGSKKKKANAFEALG